jgi:hypothetical protein
VIGALFSSDPLAAGAVFVFGAPFVLVLAGFGVGAIAWGWLFLDPSDRRFGTYLRAGGLGLIGVVLLSVMLEQWDWFVAIPVALLVIGLVGSLAGRTRP